MAKTVVTVSTTITVDGKSTRIKTFEYKLKRDVDEDRRPATPTYIPLIQVTRDALEDRGSILKWLGEPDQGKDITITIYGDSKMKTKLSVIKLSNAFVIGYHESFGLHDSKGLVEIFQITAEKIDIDGNKFDEHWP